MTYSKTHQRLSNYLSNPEVLTNPQKFLGPNWETVLRFWLYEESLTYEQWNELIRRYEAIDDDTRERAWDLASNAAIEVIGRVNRHAVFMASPVPEVLTFEIIALHELEKPFFLPLIIPEFKYKKTTREEILDSIKKKEEEIAKLKEDLENGKFSLANVGVIVNGDVVIKQGDGVTIVMSSCAFITNTPRNYLSGDRFIPSEKLLELAMKVVPDRFYKSYYYYAFDDDDLLIGISLSSSGEIVKKLNVNLEENHRLVSFKCILY
jgi:hypothetical protein